MATKTKSLSVVVSETLSRTGKRRSGRIFKTACFRSAWHTFSLCCTGKLESGGRCTAWLRLLRVDQLSPKAVCSDHFVGEKQTKFLLRYLLSAFGFFVKDKGIHDGGINDVRKILMYHLIPYLLLVLVLRRPSARSTSP